MLAAFYSFAALLAAEFNNLNTKLAAIIDDAQELKRDLPQLRKMHTQFCKLVETVDGFLAPWLGFTFLLNITEICVMTYAMAKGSSYDADPLLVGNGLLWIFCSAMYIGIICFNASCVNAKVRDLSLYVN